MLNLNNYNIMKQEELNDILKLHQMWLDNEIGGKRAN